MKVWARITLIISAALAFPLAFAPYDQSWILVAAWPAFLWAMAGLRPPASRGAGFVWGLIAFGAGISWFWNIFGARSLSLFAILAIFPALFGGAMSMAARKGWGGVKLAGFSAVAWISLEFIRCELFWLKFPWLSLGSAVAPNFLHPIIGTYGIGFMLALSLALIVHGSAKQRIAGVACSIAILCLPLLPTGANSPQDALVRVCGIQAEAVAPEEYLRLSQSAPQGTQLIIWPEYSVPFDLRKNEKIFDKLSHFAAGRGALMVVGTQTQHSADVWRNTALTFDASHVLGEHYKQHTVHFFNDGKPGTTEDPIATPLGRIGTPICFDCDFQDVVRAMTANGAEFFAVPMMDAESWGLKQHVQHSRLFRLRAAENDRWMVVVGTSGVSQIIDPEGRVVSSIPPMTPGLLIGTVGRRTGLTLYTRVGWLFPWAVLAAFTLTLPLLFRHTSRP